MIYSLDSRVLFHHCGMDRKLDLAGLIEMFQDCATLHGEDNGAGTGHLQEVGQAWVLASWQIIIEEWPNLADKVMINTWAYKVRSFLGLRNFSLTSPDGKTYAKADSQWVMINQKTMMPEKIRPEIIEAFPTSERLTDEFPSRSIKPLEGQDEKPSFLVEEYMLDCYKHINNCQYIRLAERYLIPDIKFNRFGCEYLSQTRLGETVIPKTAADDNKFQVIFENSEGKQIFIAQWEYKENV